MVWKWQTELSRVLRGQRGWFAGGGGRGRGRLLVKAEKFPGKHLVMSVPKKKSSASWMAIPWHTVKSLHHIWNSSRQGKSIPYCITQRQDLPGSPPASFPSSAAMEGPVSLSTSYPVSKGDRVHLAQGPLWVLPTKLPSPDVTVTLRLTAMPPSGQPSLMGRLKLSPGDKSLQIFG